jgi:hypothetical protein
MIQPIAGMIAIPFAFVVAPGRPHSVAASVVIAIVYWAMIGIASARRRRLCYAGAWARTSVRTHPYFLFTLDTTAQGCATLVDAPYALRLPLPLAS